MKKAREFCRLFMWANIGAFVGRAIHVYSFYRKHPEFYALTSAPWYAELLLPLIFTVAMTLILVVVQVILKKKEKEA